MPITLDEKVALDDAVAAFSGSDSVALAHILYDTLLAAKVGPNNPNGMGFKACTSLGRMVKEKGTWENLQSIEGAIEAPIRLPLIKSADVIFRSRIATDLPELPEEHKQTISYVFGKMEGDELVNLTRLLYETVVNTEFPTPAAQEAFGKLYFSGYTWEELGRSKEVKEGILAPIVFAVHNFLRETLSNTFEISEPEKTTAEESGETDAPTEGHPPEKEKLESSSKDSSEEEHGAPSAGILDGDAKVTEEQGTEPMPLPDFATKEEVEEARKADAAKVTFRGKSKKDKKSKKKSKSANGHSKASDDAEGQGPEAPESDTDEVQDTETSESAPQADQEPLTEAGADSAHDGGRETETASSGSEAASEAPSSTQEDTDETATQETPPS